MRYRIDISIKILAKCIGVPTFGGGIIKIDLPSLISILGLYIGTLYLNNFIITKFKFLFLRQTQVITDIFYTILSKYGEKMQTQCNEKRNIQKITYIILKNE